jgi:multicomponent Na+:H+ antiporter subunit D
MLLAIGTALSTFSSEINIMALKGGVFHIINDALDVGLLFLVAGAVYYVTKETSLNKLGGLARNMKYTTVFFLIGLLAVSGMPPMNGFASKLLIYESVYQVNPLLSIVAILCSILLLAVFVKVFHSVFLGPRQSSLKNVKEVPRSMLFAMAIIAGLIIVFGLFPNLIIENIITPAVNALSDPGTYINIITGGA